MVTTQYVALFLFLRLKIEQKLTNKNAPSNRCKSVGNLMTWNIYPQITLDCIKIVVKVNAWDISKQISDFLDTVPNLQQFSAQKAGFLKIHSFLTMATENLWLWFFEILSPRVLKYAFGAKSEKSWKSLCDAFSKNWS